MLSWSRVGALNVLQTIPYHYRNGGDVLMFAFRNLHTGGGAMEEDS